MSDAWEQTVFNDALDRYLAASKHTVVYVINKKSFFIARKALWYSAKTDRHRVKGELGRMVSSRRTTASGRTVRSRSLELTPSRDYEGVPLAKLILIGRYRKSGAWPKGEAAWESAIRNLIASRERSTAYLKSGWLPAIRFLANFVPNKSGQPQIDSEAKQYGSEKGGAEAAAEGNQAIARIINSAFARHDVKNSLEKFGSRALDIAFYDEANSMLEFLDEELKKDTAKANGQLA
jgi:hypothetical protein